MLKTKIKASSIANLTDARYFAAWEVKWLGFTLDPGSDDYVPPQTIKAIKEWVDGVEIVGEFAMHNPEDILTAVEMLELDAVQVSPFTAPEDLVALKNQTIIREVVVEKDTTEVELNDQMRLWAPYVRYFLLNFDKNGITWPDLQAEEQLSLDFLSNLCASYDVILSIDLDAENVEQILETLRPYGINLKGGAEEKVGYKSFEQLDEILEQLEVTV